jgi:hypothetical protein
MIATCMKVSVPKERRQIIEWYKDQRLMHLLKEHSNRFSAAWLPARHFCMHPRLPKVQSNMHFPIETVQPSSHAASSAAHSCLRHICWVKQRLRRAIARRIFVIDIISQLLIIQQKYSNTIQNIIKKFNRYLKKWLKGAFILGLESPQRREAVCRVRDMFLGGSRW